MKKLKLVQKTKRCSLKQIRNMVYNLSTKYKNVSIDVINCNWQDKQHYMFYIAEIIIETSITKWDKIYELYYEYLNKGKVC